VPLACTGPEGGPDPVDAPENAVIARVRTGEGEWTLFDALADPGLGRALLDAITRRRTFQGLAGRLVGSHSGSFRRVRGPADVSLEPSPLQAEQSNTSVVYGDRLVLKLFRHLEDGENPDLEIGRFLTEQVGFPHIPPVAGSIEYRSRRGRPMTVGMLQGFVANEGDSWGYTLDVLNHYLEDVLTQQPEQREPSLPRRRSMLELAHKKLPPLALESFGAYLESARLLGRRTAELHVALASNKEDPRFAPEPFTHLYQRSLYQSMRTLTEGVFRVLRSKARDLPQAVQILDLQGAIEERFRRILEPKIEALRIRCHGDYHLGQVLYTGRDFVIIDFEGEPARPLSERRIKRSPLTDVAGMIRSFHYAAYTALMGQTGGATPVENPAVLEPWALFWYSWVSATFLQSYLEVPATAAFLPPSGEDLRTLLDLFLLEKALYELGYEVNNRPQWLRIPIEGVIQLLEAP
jgi:maltose alpha-D-glucosyltransferase/alpha-amylase